MPFILAPLVAGVIGWYKGQKVKAQESYVKLAGKAIDTAEQSYHDQWKAYSSSLKDVGFSSDAKDITIYTSKEEIPENEFKSIRPNDYPFFKADSYQMIIRWKKESSEKETFWILDETGIVRKIN